MTEKTFIIYMATNTVNGKRYIGATRCGIVKRSNRHFKDARRKTRDCPRFYDAIRKYGRDVFDWAVLSTLLTAEEMFKEEERLIALLKPEYNIASGGLIFTSKEKQAQISKSGAQRNSKPVICLSDGSVYKSVSMAARTYGFSKPGIAHLCNMGGISRKGLSFAFLSGAISERERNELLSIRRSKKVGVEKARVEKVTRINSRLVTNLNTGIIYTSARAADKALNLVFGTAESCCRRGRATRRGDCFAFGQLSDTERSSLLATAIENRKSIDATWKEKIGKKNSRIVICENTHRLYDNPKVAAMDFGLSPDTIYAHCRSGKATQSGLSFSYLDEWCPNSA